MIGQENPPSCFGTNLWSSTDAECTGGLDVNYTNPKTGSRLRDRCNFYGACGAKAQAAALVPTRALVRPQMPTPYSIYSSAERLAQQIDPPRPTPQPMVPAQVTQPVKAMPPEGMAYGVPVGYHAMMPMPSQIPGYLSVPEYHDPRESIWSTLCREVLRGALKSIGHSLAHFVDTTPLRKPPA